MKYRKKPIVIEAHQLNMFSLMEICRWMNGRCDWIERGGEVHMVIPTLEGEMNAKSGDYIIKGIKGEFYPCKPDVFKETYERV